MDAAMERRIVVATGWASTRIAVLDKEERYEDSYAITERVHARGLNTNRRR